MQRGNLRRALALAFRRTQRAPLKRVFLYEKTDCELCAEAFRGLARLALDLPIAVERVNIGEDPSLRQRYETRVPVVVVEGRELDAAGASERELKRFVSA